MHSVGLQATDRQVSASATLSLWSRGRNRKGSHRLGDHGRGELRHLAILCLQQRSPRHQEHGHCQLEL